MFYSQEDVLFIDHFMRKMSAATSVMYEGTWIVSDESEAHRENTILNYAFNQKFEDEDGLRSTSTGKIRTFFTRSNVSTKSPEEDYFGSFFGGHSSSSDHKK